MAKENLMQDLQNDYGLKKQRMMKKIHNEMQGVLEFKENLLEEDEARELVRVLILSQLTRFNEKTYNDEKVKLREFEEKYPKYVLFETVVRSFFKEFFIVQAIDYPEGRNVADMLYKMATSYKFKNKFMPAYNLLKDRIEVYDNNNFNIDSDLDIFQILEGVPIYTENPKQYPLLEDKDSVKKVLEANETFFVVTSEGIVKRLKKD